MKSSADDVEHIVAPFLTVDEVITQPLSSLSAMFAVYGIYVVVFGLSVHILYHHDGAASKLHMGWTMSLFVLATLYTATYVWGISQQAMIYFNATTTKNYVPLFKYLIGPDEGEIVWFTITIFTGYLMNAIADSMLIHRCYIIWQSRIIMYLLASIAIILNGISFGCGIVGTLGKTIPDFQLFTTGSNIDNVTGIGTAVFQVLLALLTGGRIWWISREARRLMGQLTEARYKSIVVIIIESGVLYATCLVAALILELVVDHNAQGLVPFDLGPIVTLMSGLAPTLIIVRVAYGKSVDSVQQMVSTLQFANDQGNSQTSGQIANLQLPQAQIGGHVHGHRELDNLELSPMPRMSEEMV
ncbi:hypothetical protein L218DRAFT_1081974 [Marasmius fiardii PR-910]|nr:hypothetical protein L218DRAFT_1081974 [Marasmius fiardii PR-910]